MLSKTLVFVIFSVTHGKHKSHTFMAVKNGTVE
jgi:hypothetical protein